MQEIAAHRLYIAEIVQHGGNSTASWCDAAAMGEVLDTAEPIHHAGDQLFPGGSIGKTTLWAIVVSRVVVSMVSELHHSLLVGGAQQVQDTGLQVAIGHRLGV